MPEVEQPSFRISSFCHSGGCVAVALGPDEVAVRSSRESDGPILSFDPAGWRAFVTGFRSAGSA